MERGKTALVGGDATGAQRAFSVASDRFSSAADGPFAAILRSAGWVPVLGNTPRTVLDVADAGASAARAVATISGAVSDLPGGFTAFAPRGGIVAAEPFGSIEPALVDAERDMEHAVELVRSSPDDFLIGPVAEARRTAHDSLIRIQTALSSATSIVRGLPSFLGYDGVRHYFFAAQDPAELRGTGGVLGAFSILTVDHGRFSFGPFEPIQSLPIPPLDAVPPPSAEYAANYDRFRGGERFWLAMNLTPDTPTVGQAILSAYQVVSGDRLDGVMIADPFALRALLKVTGPTEVGELGIRVHAGNVVDMVSNEAFALFPKQPELRKRVLGDVAADVFDRFLAGTDVGPRDLVTLGHALWQGHLLVYSADAQMQVGLAETSAGGATPRAPGDFLAVIENSSGSNKVDYYEERSVAYSVQLEAEGSAHADAAVSFVNDAPSSGAPKYVLGPNPPYSRTAGEAGRLVNVYCGPGCVLESAHLDGERRSVGTGSELGHRFYQDAFSTPSGQTSHLAMRWFVRDAWAGDDRGGTYRLTFLNQTTIRPTHLAVTIHAPEGTSIVDASPGIRVDGAVATWSGVPGRETELTVSFQVPLGVRLWRTIT
jgi:hypothetical protein